MYGLFPFSTVLLYKILLVSTRVVFSYSQPSSEISSLISVTFDAKLDKGTVSLCEEVLAASVTTICGAVGLGSIATEDNPSGVGSVNVLPEIIIQIEEYFIFKIFHSMCNSFIIISRFI